jgi:hypothetical protein
MRWLRPVRPFRSASQWAPPFALLRGQVWNPALLLRTIRASGGARITKTDQAPKLITGLPVLSRQTAGY